MTKANENSALTQSDSSLNSADGFVATIGNFDGVHLGHQALLRKIVSEAKLGGLRSLVVTFYPHPANFFTKCENFLIQTLAQRTEKIRSSGVDECLVLDFNQDLSRRSAEDFAQLLESLNVKKLILGQDCSFGRDKEGGIEFLLGRKSRMLVEVFAYTFADGQKVSSSMIRASIESGDMESASARLSKHFCVSGVVKKGQARGRLLGFPTANLYIRGDDSAQIKPMVGVYVVMIGLGNLQYAGVANFGYRPTFESKTEEAILEVHILDFAEDIYGQVISVEFLKMLRGEKKFENVDDLRQQIAQDKARAIEFFKNLQPQNAASSHPSGDI